MRCVRICFLLLLSALFHGQTVQAAVVVDGSMILRTIQERNLCALTFDDGPSKYTPALLDILRERGIPATFFVVGSQIRYHPQLVQRIQAEGHEVGNHTASHVSLRHRPIAEQRAQIKKVQDALAKLGVVSRYIRPPYGRYDLNTVAIADQEHLGIVLWSVDSADWMQKVQFDTLQSLNSKQKNRGIFLFHDTHAPTIAAMPALLDRLIEGGCRFVTISQFLEEVDGPSCPRLIQAGTQPGPSDQVQTPGLPATGSMGGVTQEAREAESEASGSAKEGPRHQSPATALAPEQDTRQDEETNAGPFQDFLKYFQIKPLSHDVEERVSEDAA